MSERKPFVGGQNLDELDPFIELVNADIKPVSYLEVGARRGRALDYFVRRVPTLEHVSVVDWPGQDWGRKDSEIELERRLNELASSCNITFEIHLGNSQTQKMADHASIFDGFDLVFIDADHTYDGVKKDYELYAPMANIAVCLHDINHPPDSRAYGPTKLWEEITGNKVAIIGDQSRKGIGVVYK